MILPGSYANGFAPRDGHPLYPELWRGCVGAWAPCLGPTGLTLRDWSGYGNHGTLTNGPTWQPSSGKYALRFDGTDDFVTAPNTYNYGTSFSVSLWFNVPSAKTSGRIIGNSGNGITIYHDTGIGLTFYAQVSASVWCQRGIGNSFYGTGWRHLYCEYSLVGGLGDVMVMAIDGVPRSRSARQGAGSPTGISSNVAFTIDSATFPNAAGSQYDDVRLYTRPLGVSEYRRCASRRGIAYELAPRRRASVAVQFNRRRRLLIGASH